ncbi:MAG: ATP phosphoribosyltransferase regulatory subunit [Clostridiales bacterium]|nr:ATP phosphoribosyltransferase regulatory subunit [Clostridiales bacterium]
MQRLLHTPEGFRDLYKDECSEKQWLGQELQKVFSSYGYESIETPTVEFLEVFGREIGTTPSRELYRFFDRKGFTMMALMITLGVSLRASHLLPDVAIAVFYTGLGGALAMAGILFMKAYIEAHRKVQG